MGSQYTRDQEHTSELLQDALGVPDIDYTRIQGDILIFVVGRAEILLVSGVLKFAQPQLFTNTPRMSAARPPSARTAAARGDARGSCG